MSEVLTERRCFRCGDLLPERNPDLVCTSCEDSILIFAELKDLDRVEREIRRHFQPAQVKELARRLHWGNP